MTSQTLSKMYEMKLHGMAASFRSRRIMPDHQDLNHDEFTALLVDEVIDVFQGGGRKLQFSHLQQAALTVVPAMDILGPTEDS